ncbi:PREDICTED: sodium/hydrogen exchanger 10-like [Nicrophorus vespilloides]|uniref:Sodium/hydrogen exchanger 10-like n=1 Tax=Nicrophorus vespilloides TaxID=110193 RepID=A0ABM1MAF3_NICVS|nr:PREDICTED: sodium/hydrogen exchanger 10-like [Nicrophorus vespilloides]
MNYSLEGFEIYENSHELHSDIAICVIPVLLAIILTSVLSNLYIPHELVAMLVGGGLGIIITYMPLLHRMAERFWAPYDVLVVLQPILMLKMLYTVDTFIFMKSLSQILLVSTVGLFMFILIFGFFLMILTLHEASLINVIIAGSILAPIDIPDLILELERVKNLEVLMDGESTFGTALCLMTFDLCVGGYAGIITKWYQVVCFYLRYIIVSTVVGYILGKTTAVLFRLLYNDFMNAVVALVASSYMVYFLCEHIFYCSGTIGCFINIFCLSLERPSLSLDVDVEIQRFLNICYYNAELFSTVVLSACVMVRLLDFFKDFQFPLALGVYIIGSVIRFLTLLLLSPILSRIGYGLDFTGLLAIFWAAKKGPLQIITTIALTHHSIIDDVGSEILCFTLVYLVLLYLINGTTLKFILQKFGLILFSEARKNNINNCFKFINERRLRLISALKMNRFYSDSNWPLIHEATKLFNPFKVETVHGLVEDTDLWGFRTTYCPTCVKNVPVDPTKKDYLEMMNEVRRRVLKTERVSYVKQYEVGILDQHELRALLEYVEKAVDSKELIIHLDDIMRLFKDTQVILKLKKYLMSFKFRDLGTAPQNRIKRTFYTIAISRNYEFTLYAIILLNIVSAVVEMLLLYYHIPDFDIMVIVNTIFFTIYLVDFFIKIVGYSNYSLSQGVKLFFRLIWNRLDFMMLILATIDIIITNLIYLSNAIRYNYVLESFAILRIFRILRLSKLVSEKFYLKMLSHCDNLIDNRLTYAFTIGKALVIGYEEATELIPKIVNNFKIQEGIRSQLENDKVTVSKELGIIAKERPWIATNVKTKQAILATLVFMRNNIYQLKTDVW